MPPSVAIIGGGPAGLTAAYRLASTGARITLIEQSTSVGGRLASTEFTTQPLWLFGCHTATRTLLSTLNPGNGRLLHPVQPEFFLPDSRIGRLRRPWLPAPIHTVIGLLSCRNLPWTDRWRLLSFLERIWEGAECLPSDLENWSADEWLKAIGQSDEARRLFWNTLAAWMTGTHLTRLSAAAWVHTMQPPFLGSRADAQLDLVAATFREWFIDPINRCFDKADAVIRVGLEAVQLQVEKDAVTAVRLRDGTTVQAEWYVMALPHRRLQALLPERLLTNYAYFQHITELCDVPAITVHLLIQGRRPAPRLILCGGRSFESVALTQVEQGTSILLAAYGNDAVMSRPDEELARSALGQIHAIVPDAKEVAHSTTIARHPAAFLSLHPGSRALRPLQRSPIRNLLVAGAWTDTGWPSHLESAVVSGTRCAEIITGQRR